MTKNIMPNFCIYIVMEIEVCDTFYYRIPNKKVDIYAKFNSSKCNVLRNNEALDLYSGEYVKITQNSYFSHFVKPAETLANIAKAYNITVQKLKIDNNLESDKLFIGQLIKIYK